jgi:hypothetical protein
VTEQHDEGRTTPLDRWVAYRRRRIQESIDRDRDSRIPTWALALLLVLFVAAWVGFVAVFG